MDTPWWATGAFWAGIAISTVIGIAINIFTNLTHNKIVSWLDTRKLISQEKRRSAAVQLNKIVNEIHSGKRDRTSYIIRIAISIIFSSTMVTAATVLGIGLMALFPIKGWSFFPDIQHLEPKLAVSFAFALILQYMGIGFMIISLRRFRQVTNALDNYDEYQAKFITQWGERSFH